jgi:hypothetical protein
MNKDLINLIINIIMVVVGVATAIYQYPGIAVVLFGIALASYLGYVGYVEHKGVPGNTLLRMSPIIGVVVLGCVIYWFWPAALSLVLYTDLNANGRRDKNDPPLQNEKVVIIDSANYTQTDSTGADGELSVRIPPGEIRLQIRGFQIMGDVARGNNRIHIGFLPDKTHPDARIFVGDEPGVPMQETPARRIFANIWTSDRKSDLSKIEIDWGEGKGYEPVDVQQPSMQFNYIQHDYQTVGRKTIRLRVTNKAGLSNIQDPSVPPEQKKQFDVISIK